MPRVTRRELWLAIIAAVNLVVWAAVAATIAVVASDQVDLGIELTVRKYQATAVALLPGIGHLSPGSLSTAPDSTSGSGLGTTAITGDSDSQVVGNPGQEPAFTPAAGGGKDAAPSGSIGAAMGDGKAKPAPGVSQANPPLPSPSGAAMPASQPLILVNPEFSSLQSLDVEMRRSAVGRPVQISFDAATLSDELTALLNSWPDMPLHNVRVNLKPGEVIATGSVLVLGVEVTAKVEANVTASNCVPQVEITSIVLGSVVTPGLVKDSIKAEIEKLLGSYLPDYPLCILQIVLEENGATVRGYRR